MRALLPLCLLAACSATRPVARSAAPREGPGPLMTRWGASLDPGRVLPEHPRPQFEREEWLCLNGPWEFAEAREGEPPPFARTLPERILVPFPVESSLSGIGRRAERVWYRRAFDVPSGWRGRRILLHFDAVDWESRVFVNGKELATHRGGYDAFTIDVTEALQDGGPQELVVGVHDPTDAGGQPRGKQVREPEGIWYTPSTGIWQTVWLEPVPDARIRGLELATDFETRRLWIRTVHIPDAASRGVAHVLEAVAYADGKEVARASGRAGAELVLEIPGARPWSPWDPFLHDLRLQLVREGRVVDTVYSYFGMRSIEVAKDESGIPRILLNGSPLFEVGVLDQGFWPDGICTAPSDAALRSDVELAKKLGFNLIRKHVKVEPDRWYTWCDRLGVLVWQDMPSGDNRTADDRRQFGTELERLIQLRRNHPSIIAWVVFNEGWGQHDTARLVERVRELDPTRLVSNASGWTDESCGHIVDVHAYPGPAAPRVEAARAAVLGEFGGLGLHVEGHSWRPESWGYRGVADREELTSGYVNLLRRAWELGDTGGLCAVVYTQLTDVETECNGLVSYDREVVKVDVDRVRAANKGVFPKLTLVVPTSQARGLAWRHRFEAPGASWQDARYDDSSWSSGPGGFGVEGTPGAVVRTEWSTSDIWLRRTIALDGGPLDDLALYVHHDEDVEIWIDGILAAKAGGYTTGYEPLAISAEARAALTPGEHVLAVHCRQTSGGQYVDVGIVRVE